MNCLARLFGAKQEQPKESEPVPIENVAPVPISVVPKRLRGIDVSHYEPEVDWVKAKASGVVWMYTKATEGLGHVDAMLNNHVKGANLAGVYTGAYHFFHASQDGKQQASVFLNNISNLSLDLIHCLDWESSSADGLPALIQKARAKDWLNEVERVTGKVPMIYGGESFLNELNLGPEFLKYKVWIAHYGVPESRVKVPAPWVKYTAWQYTDAEGPPIVQGLKPGHHVDASWLNGSIDLLRKS